LQAAGGIEQQGKRVDCVLIYPPWTVLYGRAFLTNCLPPLGLLTIAACLEREGYSVRIIDVNAERIDSDELRERLQEYQPRYVGLTVLSSMVVSSHCIAKLVKEVVPDCTIALGGVHPELYPELMLRNSAVDLVIRGDGERPMIDLVSGKAWSEVPGASYRTQDLKVVHNPIGPLLTDLDCLPMPAYHMVDFKNYFPSASSYRNLPAMNIIATRGCPGKCTFCNSANTGLRGRSAQNVFEQIKHLHDSYGIRQIQFFDDTFTANKKMVLELCELMAQAKLNITFSCYARGDCFNEKMAAALKSAGCHQVMIGIETGSDKLAKLMGKPIKKENYKTVVDMAHRHGIEVRAGFIIGHQEETLETMHETLNFAMELDVDYFQLSLLTPYPGTQLYRQALAEKRLVHQEFKYYGQSRVLLKLNHLSEEEVLAFERYSFRKFYIRPQVAWRMIKRLRNLRQLKDLTNALFILVLNRFKSEKPKWTDWDDAEEEDQYDLILKGSDVQASLVPPRLTWEVRESKSIMKRPKSTSLRV